MANKVNKVNKVVVVITALALAVVFFALAALGVFVHRNVDADVSGDFVDTLSIPADTAKTDTVFIND